MKIKSSEIFIHAAPEKIWSVLTDLNHWADWNSQVKSVQGEAKTGNKLKVTMKAGGEKGTLLTPTITKLEKDKQLVWTSKMAGGLLFKNQKILELNKTENGTRVTHKELYGGLMPRLFWGKFEKLVIPMLNSMNEGLKQKVESN